MTRTFRVLSTAAVLGLVAVAYAPGLFGEFQLDDFSNLEAIQRFLKGQLSWAGAVFDNRSGVLGRPISMASFVVQAQLTGELHAWPMKAANLAIHLLCGVVVIGLLRRLLARDARLAPHADSASLLLGTLWLAAPLHVSTVLYVIQRMAQLSTLFTLLGLLVFVAARERIERQSRGGVAMLFIGVPTLTLLAIFSKENGALLPLLAFALEVGYFAPRAGLRRPIPVLAFFALSLAVPTVLGAIALAIHPGWLTGGYVDRPFTLTERVLTEPRILWSYIAATFVPVGPSLGLFHDNFPKSTSLLSPWTTAPAILAWLALLAAGWRTRVRYPAILAGTLLFLFAHAMESSVIALELYFEHRNYLPSVGALLAAAGIVALLLDRLPPLTRGFRRALAAASLLLPACFLVATNARAFVWQSNDTIYLQDLAYNPDSPRLRSNLAGLAIQAGDRAAALSHIDVAEANSPVEEKTTADLWRLLAYCAAKEAPPPGAIEALASPAGNRRLSQNAMVAFELLSARLEANQCPAVDRAAVAQATARLLSATSTPLTGQSNWRTRYNLARVLAGQGRLDDAAREGRIAWESSDYSNGIGVFLFQVNASLGRTAECREILARLQRAEGGGDLRLNEAIRAFREALRTGSIPAVEPVEHSDIPSPGSASDAAAPAGDATTTPDAVAPEPMSR